MAYHGIDGFLGTRASIMLDVVFLAMFAIIPLMGWSIWLVKFRQAYALHKRLQLGLGAAVGRRRDAIRSRYAFHQRLARSGRAVALFIRPVWVVSSLGVHLVFATTTALLWIVVIVRALRNFPNPPMPRRTAEPMCSGPGWRPATCC